MRSLVRAQVFGVSLWLSSCQDTGIPHRGTPDAAVIDVRGPEAAEHVGDVSSIASDGPSITATADAVVADEPMEAGIVVAAAYQLPGQTVQGCKPNAYVDRRAADADRELAWTFGFGADDARCFVVQLGQAVVFRGNLGSHPLDAEGGDVPSPITEHNNGVVHFDRLGTFGFVCGHAHSGMWGAVHVVP